MGSLTLNGSVSGQITVSPPSAAGTNTITLPAATGTVLTTAGGQNVNTSIGINGSSSGTITLAVPAAAGTNTITLAAQTGTLNVAGPAFHATAAGTQTISSGTSTKALFATEDFDTNSNFASSTFTPTVAGYYQINSGLRLTAGTSVTWLQVEIYKNGSPYRSNRTPNWSGTSADTAMADVVYCNGSTDYVEIYATTSGTGTLTLHTQCYFSGCLMRGA